MTEQQISKLFVSDKHSCFIFVMKAPKC